MEAIIDLVRSLIGENNASIIDDVQSLIDHAMTLALTPFRIATSRAAIKVYLSFVLFIAISTVLLSMSGTAFFFFYYKFIPQISVEKPIYLQYAAGIHPYATINLESSGLISQQAYDVDILLHVPRTPSNLAAGNFMIDVALFTDTPSGTPGIPPNYHPPATSDLTDQKALFRSRRPATLPYSSVIPDLSYTILHLPSHLLRLRDLDSSNIKVPMFEKVSFARGRSNIPTYAYIQIQTQTMLPTSEPCSSAQNSQQSVFSPSPPTSPSLHIFPDPSNAATGTLQTYTAKLRFKARFQGLRYIVYNYRVLSYLVFSALFYVFSLTSMGMAWVTLTNVLKPEDNTPKLNDRGVPLIKGEPGANTGTGPSTTAGKQRPQDSRIKSEPRGLDLSRIQAERAGETGPSHITPDSSDEEKETQALLERTQQYDPNDEEEEGHHAHDREQEDQDHIHDAEDEEDDDIEEATALGGGLERIRSAEVKVEDDDDDDDRRFTGDSGIGTSMESENAGPSTGLVRRRSGRRS